MVDEQTVKVVFQIIRHSAIHVLVALLATTSFRHPTQILTNPPHVCVDWKLCALQVEHEDASGRLRAHTLEPHKLIFHLLVRHNFSHILHA